MLLCASHPLGMWYGVGMEQITAQVNALVDAGKIGSAEMHALYRAAKQLPEDFETNNGTVEAWVLDTYKSDAFEMRSELSKRICARFYSSNDNAPLWQIIDEEVASARYGTPMRFPADWDQLTS